MPCCPGCGRCLSRHGVYWRLVYLPGNEHFRILIYRFRCRPCRLTVSLLPDFLVPYYRYAAAVIGAVLSAFAISTLSRHRIATALQAATAETAGMLLVPRLPSLSTVRAWIRRFSVYLQAYLDELARWSLRLEASSPALHLLADRPGEGPPADPARHAGGKLIRIAGWFAKAPDGWLPWLNRFVLGTLAQIPWRRPPPAPA